MGDGRRGGGSVGSGADAAEPGTAGGEAASVVFVLLAVAVAWGASAVVLHLLLRTSWGVSLGAAPLLLMVATILRNAVRFRRRRRLRTEQSR